MVLGTSKHRILHLNTYIKSEQLYSAFEITKWQKAEAIFQGDSEQILPS